MHGTRQDERRFIDNPCFREFKRAVGKAVGKDLRIVGEVCEIAAQNVGKGERKLPIDEEKTIGENGCDVGGKNATDTIAETVIETFSSHDEGANGGADGIACVVGECGGLKGATMIMKVVEN